MATTLRLLMSELEDREGAPLLPPDGYPLDSAKDPYAAEQQLLTAPLREICAAPHGQPPPQAHAARLAKALLPKDPRATGRLLMAAWRRGAWFAWRLRYPMGAFPNTPMSFHARHFFSQLLEVFLKGPFDLEAAEELELLETEQESALYPLVMGSNVVGSILEELQRRFGNEPPKDHLAVLRKLAPQAATRLSRAERELLAQLTGAGDQLLSPLSSDYWGGLVCGRVEAMPPEKFAAWRDLLHHAAKATAARPTSKWLDKAKRLVEAVGQEAFDARFAEWTSAFLNADPTATMHEQNRDTMRGFLWHALLRPNPDIVRQLGKVALGAYKPVPGVGARDGKIGNAALVALELMSGLDGIRELSLVGQRIRYRPAHKIIKRAIGDAAEANGVTPDDLEEIITPEFGLSTNGQRSTPLAGCLAELRILSTKDVELRWLSEGGHEIKAPTAAAKRENAEEIKELKQAVKDIERTLTATCRRLDLAMRADRSWSLADWRERYTEHPLLTAVGRRLIWRFDSAGAVQDAIWRKGRLEDATGEPITVPEDAWVRLWHPIESTETGVLAWRERIMDLEITQPFKQAFRELYVITDAEFETRTYSNRFAALVVRQHQMMALAKERGWRTKLLTVFDAGAHGAEAMPTLTLPDWGLSAQLWVEAVGGELATNDAGMLLHLGTDQVRFRAPDGEPVQLVDVPARVFSEVMRDVDLFVGVAGVGADPAWQDGGDRPEDRRRVWHAMAFGNLGETAKSRADALQMILPKLKIADRCRIEGRFLHVRGELRSYKIHLGSGNILMEPDDRYLCIVPDRKKGHADGVFLPFEGDVLLSTILSKAFLLAGDRKIEDATILRQIDRPALP